MNLHELVLAFHIACGTGGIILGPVVMQARKMPGRHTKFGEIYHWLFLAVFLSASALSIMNWERLWWLLPVGIGSYAFALLGYLSAKLRWQHWLLYHLAGQGGSYIAMTTAVLVVNFGTGAWWAWVLPTIVGSPMITWINYEIARGRRPKYA